MKADSTPEPAPAARGRGKSGTSREERRRVPRRQNPEPAHVGRVSALGELLASLAHELNQPLAAILSNAQASQRLLALPVPDVAEAKEALRDIAQDAARASGIIQRLRSLLCNGAPERVSLSIAEVVQEALLSLRGELRNRGLAPRLALAPDLPPVLADRIEMLQVVLNLVLNAAEAIAAVEADFRELVIGAARIDPATVEVTVRDSGVGLAPESLGRVFDAFYTTKPGGMGMGLAISRSIIESLGGKLWAARNPDRGATFHFTLPIHQGASP